ncbi:MAG: glycosyltransferase [Candidatus Shapirobacteria bacterium]|nr:glycosyltransferase [Candidatus Shapirobacteria bacterium]MDD5074100.1 glycosyltransferase [Candidatus Shapirobacteria bacterium]MDD5481939.1 glycosyltransferase [Candidatus Shapirobacteria bacterium]
MIVLQVAHITKTPGPVQSLARFFCEKKGTICYQILHPLDDSLANSLLKKDGKSIIQKKRLLPGVTKYFSSFFLTLKWLKKLPERVDLGVGMNCFDTLALIVAQKLKLKKITRIVFFNTDFSRIRFQNPLLNRLYIAVDKFAAKGADFLCCNTKRTIRARTKEGINKNKIIYVPNGVFLKDIGWVNNDKIFLPQLVYVGSLNKDHGLQNIFPILAKTSLRLFIIGSGSDEGYFKRLVQEQKLVNQVFFLGFMKHKKTLEYLKNFSGFGLAPYSQKYDWVYYADPVKIKEYLACLVPPITTNTTEISQIIKNNNLGFVYQKSPKKVFQKIASLNNNGYKNIISHIVSYQINIDYNRIYQKIFQLKK